MVSRQLLRSCQATADALPLREPYGSAQLVDDLAEARGRPIHITPLPWLDGPSLPCGVWIATGDTDYVFIGKGRPGSTVSRSSFTKSAISCAGTAAPARPGCWSS